MNKIHLIFRLIKSVFDINKVNNPRSRYHRDARELIKIITAPYKLEDVSNIPTDTKLKMQWYMAECIYACEKFNEISGQRSTSEQRRTYLLSGALVAMCDLIIDDIEMDIEQIKLFKKPTNTDEFSDMVGKLYSSIYNTFIDALEEDVKIRTINYYELLFDAQIRSKQQFDPNLTREDADSICKEKCGYSGLFLRSMVKGEISTIEKDAWFEIGAFIQYCNDAQDLHKDLQNKMRTFASTRPDIETIAKDIDKQKTIAFSLVKEIPFQKRKKDDLLFILHVMCIAIFSKLHAFTRICDYNFSFENFELKSKKEVRSKLSPLHLFRYWLPRALNYRYEDADAPYKFKYSLTNRNLS